MRILHCFKVYRPDHNGGIEEAISRIVAGTAHDATSSILVCRLRGLGSKIVVDGCPVERTTTLGQISSLPISPTYLMRMIQRMRSADVIAFHAPFPFIDVGIQAGLRDDQALVIHWHADIVGRNWLRPLFEPLLRRSVDRADRIMVTDSAMVDSSPFLRSAPDKCRVAPYGIDTAWWSELDADDLSATENLRRSHGRLVAACGRLVSYKGFDVLIRAMKRVDAHLIIIGTGPLEAELRGLVQALGLSSRVTFAGFVDRPRQRQILNASTMFVLPSVTVAEGFGIVQLEAMSCGLPVINTKLPTTVPHVARHDLEGLTVPPGDEIELAASMNRLLGDPELAASLGSNGRLRAREKYGWAAFAALANSTYAEALASRRMR